MIIGISGKIGSGKDTIGKIIQILIDSPQLNNKGIISCLNGEYNNPSWKIKKFADKLKDIVCLLIGCTREQLEDPEFKNKELGEEWWIYELTKFPRKIVPYNYYKNDKDNELCNNRYLIKLTPRLLLQLLGTECGRNIIHPSIWINALMSEYKTKEGKQIYKESVSYGETTINLPIYEPEYPNWIITDTRFPNELKAIKDRKGISIRVNRYRINKNKEHQIIKEHESETALDNAEFDYIIDNNGSIEDLIEKVKEILIKECIIN